MKLALERAKEAAEMPILPVSRRNRSPRVNSSRQASAILLFIISVGQVVKTIDRPGFPSRKTFDFNENIAFGVFGIPLFDYAIICPKAALLGNVFREINNAS